MGATLTFTTPASVAPRLPRPPQTVTLMPTPTPTSGVTQIPVLCFHGIGTPSRVVDSVDYYNTTLANFKAEMAWLASNGYQTITPQQYTAWLAGKAVTLPAKPVLITFDDAFPNHRHAGDPMTADDYEYYIWNSARRMRSTRRAMTGRDHSRAG